MADRIIDIKLKLTEEGGEYVVEVSDDLEELAREARKATGPMDRAGKSIKDAGQDAEKSSRGLRLMDGLMVGLGAKAVDLAAKLPGAAMEMVNLGAQTEAMEHRFTQFAGGTKEAGEYLDAFNQASDGTVSKMEAMAGGSKLLGMGLVDNADEMETFVALATKLGDQTMSAGDRLSDFAALIANKSTPRLDNFNIASGEAKAKMEELLASGKALNDDEAFKMAVFEIGKESLKKLGDTSELTATKLARAKAQWADLKTEMAEAIVQSELANDVFTDLDWRTQQMELKRLGDEMVRNGLLTEEQAEAKWKEIAAISATTVGIDGLITTKREMRDQMEAMTVVLEEYNSLLDENASKTGFAADYIGGWAGKMSEADLEGKKLEKRLAAISQAESDWIANASAQDWADEYANMGIRAESAMVDLADGINEVGIATANAATPVDEWKASMEEATQMTQNAALAQMDLAQRLADATDAQIAQAAISQLKQALDNGEISFEDYQTAVSETQLAFGLATPESVALSESVLGLTSSLIEGELKANQYNEALAAVIASTQEGTSSTQALIDALNSVPNYTSVDVSTGLMPRGGHIPIEPAARGFHDMVGPGFGGPRLLWVGEGSQPERVNVDPVRQTYINQTNYIGGRWDSRSGPRDLSDNLRNRLYAR